MFDLYRAFHLQTTLTSTIDFGENRIVDRRVRLHKQNMTREGGRRGFATNLIVKKMTLYVNRCNLWQPMAIQKACRPYMTEIFYFKTLIILSKKLKFVFELGNRFILFKCNSFRYHRALGISYASYHCDPYGSIVKNVTL